jgi:putative transcriptional regulator
MDARKRLYVIMNNIFKIQARPRKGSLLLAEPFMDDPNFKRSVLILCEHNENGTFGLVLSRPLELVLGDVMPDLEYFESRLYYGGPCEQNTMHYLHRYGKLIDDCVNLGNGIFWGGHFEQIKQYILSGDIKPEGIRFYVGFSGWDPQQLNTELDEQSWLVAENTYDYVFSNETDNLWRTILNDLGGDYRQIALYPENPNLN